jgi:hypothetical protein
MGTRALTFVYDNDGQTAIMNLYRQFDGYPDGHGAELAEFLMPLQIVNGYSPDATNQANGMPCLAAQLVAHFKTGTGGFYLYPVGTTDCGQDYVYHVYADKVVVTDYDQAVLFEGSWAEFASWCIQVD